MSLRHPVTQSEYIYTFNDTLHPCVCSLFMSRFSASKYIYIYIFDDTLHIHIQAQHYIRCRVATISRLLKIIGLFCKRAL